jgi:hypothetical protein
LPATTTMEPTGTVSTMDPSVEATVWVKTLRYLMMILFRQLRILLLPPCQVFLPTATESTASILRVILTT